MKLMIYKNRKSDLYLIFAMAIVFAVNCWLMDKSTDTFISAVDMPQSTATLDSGQIASVEKLDADYLIIIEKIAALAPIILNVDGADENTYFPALKKGVAHLQGSAKPGENGNIVIFGHSSQAVNTENKYGDIFSRLNELKNGDEIIIYIAKKKKQILYKVTDKNIVNPDDVSATYDTGEDKLTLITCWPIGSDEQRLIITAK